MSINNALQVFVKVEGKVENPCSRGACQVGQLVERPCLLPACDEQRQRQHQVRGQRKLKRGKVDRGPEHSWTEGGTEQTRPKPYILYLFRCWKLWDCLQQQKRCWPVRQ